MKTQGSCLTDTSIHPMCEFNECRRVDGEGGLALLSRVQSLAQLWRMDTRAAPQKRTKEQTQQFNPNIFLWFSKTLNNLPEAAGLSGWPYAPRVTRCIPEPPHISKCNTVLHSWAAAVCLHQALWVTGRKAASAGPSLRPWVHLPSCSCGSQPPLGSPQSGPPFLPEVDLPFHIPSYVTGFFPPSSTYHNL